MYIIHYPVEILNKLSNNQLRVLAYQQFYGKQKQKLMIEQLNIPKRSLIRAQQELEKYKPLPQQEYLIEVTPEWLVSDLTFQEIALVQYLIYLNPEVDIENNLDEYLNTNNLDKIFKNKIHENQKTGDLIYLQGKPNDGIYQQTLADIFNVDRTRINKILRRLEEKKIIAPIKQYIKVKDKVNSTYINHRSKNQYQILTELFAPSQQLIIEKELIKEYVPMNIEPNLNLSDDYIPKTFEEYLAIQKAKYLRDRQHAEEILSRPFSQIKQEDIKRFNKEEIDKLLEKVEVIECGWELTDSGRTPHEVKKCGLVHPKSRVDLAIVKYNLGFPPVANMSIQELFAPSLRSLERCAEYPDYSQQVA